MLTKGSHKISTFHIDDYRNIARSLNSNEIDWYNFENKQTRPIKVMIKNLNYSNTSDTIVTNLRSQGFKAIEDVNKFQWKSKQPLNMFRVSFESKKDVKNKTCS